MSTENNYFFDSLKLFVAGTLDGYFADFVPLYGRV